MIGGLYLEHGRPVRLLAAWRGTPAISILPTRAECVWIRPPRKGRATTGPRNVLIQRENGDLVVRPFRGLRRPEARV